MRAAAVLGGAIALLTLLSPSCVSFDDLGRAGTASPSSGRCGECHGAVFAEWKASPHARAFLAESFLAQTDGGEIRRCVPCHAPGPLTTELRRPFVAREDHREEGVHCLACHRIEVGHGEAGGDPERSRTVMAGPLEHDALVQPHAIDPRGEWFRDAAFCGRCHEDTYREWLATTVSQAPTCQECHMPALRRKVTQATDFVSRAIVAFEKEHELRAHTFDVGSATTESRRFLADGFLELELTRLPGALHVALRNRLPHGLPTGGFGAHRVEVRARLARAPGSTEPNSQRELAGKRERTVYRRTLRTQGGRVLASGAALEFEIPVGVNDARLVVEIERVDSSGETREPLATFDVFGALAGAADEPLVRVQSTSGEGTGG